MTNSRAKAKRSEQKKPASGKGFGTTGTGLLYNRKPSLNAKCACDLDKTYSECCSPMHEGADAATPEELVRARYTAYAYRLPDFLMATTDPEGSEYEADAAGWKRSLLGFCVRAPRPHTRLHRPRRPHRPHHTHRPCTRASLHRHGILYAAF